MLLSLELCKPVAWSASILLIKECLENLVITFLGRLKVSESAFLYTTEDGCSCATKLESIWTAYRELELFYRETDF